MNKKMTLTGVLLSILSLTACGEKGLVIKSGPAGPNTGDLIDPLPDSLVGDKTNTSHSNEDLKPVIN
jgi:hypothetical protein